MKQQDQVGQTANGQPVVRKLRHRGITMQEVEEMARLTAMRLTDTEAALMLGLKPENWLHWKSRNKNDGRFQQILARTRGIQLRNHIENIEAAETGERPDWRASLAMLKIKAPERYGDQPAQAQQVNVQVSIGFTDALAKVYGQAQDQHAISSPVDTTKLLTDKPLA